MKTFVICILLTVPMALCAPSPGGAAAVHVEKTLSVDSPISFDKGNVGVNFAGYHASAGLGGLLSGDAAAGGLHAEAGTPHGQAAGAGLGGAVEGKGKTGGVLYAGATAGGAAAGTYAHRTIHQGSEVISEKSYTEAPKVIYEHTVQDTPVVHRTVIEKTVIPQYVEKTIQVPSYVEKTVRVPTVVEHKVRVPVTPKVVEKTYDENLNANAGYKTMTVDRPTAVVHKEYAGQGYGGFQSAFNFGAGAGAGVGGGAVAGAGAGVGPVFVKHPHHRHHFAATVAKSPTLFNDIFAIPISALGAVNNLLNGISGRAGGSVSLTKSFGHA